MGGLKAGRDYLIMQTYRETFHLSVENDEVIVQLSKSLLGGDKMPEQITVTIEWDGGQ